MSNKPTKDRLTERLVYYKSYNTVQDIYANELSYSLIYDNIHPSKINDALSTVRLSSLPNRFLVMRVDDYSKHSRQLHMTYEPFQKMVIINLLKKQMDIMALRGFIGNLIDLDQFICFLCCDEKEDIGIREFLLSVGRAFQNNIAMNSDYSLSICVSNCCNKISDYSLMFTDMDSMLKESYYKIKGSIMFLEDMQPEAATVVQNSALNELSASLLVAIARHDHAQVEAISRHIKQRLLESPIPLSKVHGEMLSIVLRVESYCCCLGIPADVLSLISDDTIKQIFATNFVSDICESLQSYCGKVISLLPSCGNGGKLSFAALTKEYIAEHYSKVIRLDDVAKVMGFSKRHFTRLFAKYFNTTFTEYVNTYRIDQSKALLAETDIPIEQIALNVGFNSYSYFCTCFKQNCGTSPRVYRIQHAGL